MCHRYTLLGFRLAGVDELEVEEWEPAVNESVALSGLTSSDVVSLEELELPPTLTDVQKERATLLRKAKSNLLKSRKQAAESGFEVLLGSRKTRKKFR